jgi:hypothetical protein
VADSKISALTEATSPALTDEFPVNQGGTSKRMLLSTVSRFAAANAMCVLTADYTLTSQTAAQKLFNASTNGAVTLPVGLYYFEAVIQLTGMSGTSGNARFDFGGTAVLANPRLVSAIGMDSTSPATGAAVGGSFVQGGIIATTNIVTAATGTALSVQILGIFAITTAGTVIPQISLTTASAAVVKAGSFILFNQIGASSTDNLRGSWS